jgi:hypothetical protein
VLLIADAGAERPLPAFDRQELQAIVDLVQHGGGLVFFGAARRPADGPHPYVALLHWFGIVVRPDRLSLSPEAPTAYPEQWALAYATGVHAVTQRARQAAFPIASPSLQVGDASWALMRPPPFVGSREADDAGPALVAARQFGRGRVLVFASLPPRNPSVGRALSASVADPALLIADGLAWVSEPARRLTGGAP